MNAFILRVKKRSVTATFVPIGVQMKLTGEQVKLLQDALLEAYDRNSLRRIMRIGMDADFDDIVPDGAYIDQVYAVIEWAEKQARLPDLIRCVCAENPDNAQLQKVAALLSSAPAQASAAQQAAKPARSHLGGMLMVALAVIAVAAAGLLIYNSLINRTPAATIPASEAPAEPAAIEATASLPIPTAVTALAGAGAYTDTGAPEPQAISQLSDEVPPTATLADPTAAPAMEPAALMLPTPTPIPPTETQPPPTPAPPAPTQVPPTPTPAPPTPTQVPPTATATPIGGGGRIVFDRGQADSRDIYSMAPDGSDLVNLTNNAADDWVGSLSPDGRWLLFSSNRGGNWDIYAQDMAQGLVSRLTDDPAEDHDPAWSPDDGRVLFHSNRRDGVWQLYSVAANGSDLRQVTNEPSGAWAGAWSPDGSRIAYSANFPQPADIYVANADGSGPLNVTNTPSHESTVAWSPDGSRIAFYSDRDGNRELYVANADGANPVRLTDNPAVDSMPAFSPDGRQIVFASDRQGDMDIYRLDLETGSLVQLTSDLLPEGSPSWSR